MLDGTEVSEVSNITNKHVLIGLGILAAGLLIGYSIGKPAKTEDFRLANVIKPKLATGSSELAPDAA